jgi:arginine/lysine/ornithine decarboxylase
VERRAALEMPPVPELAMTLREGYYAPSVAVPLSAAAGRICAETIIPYPPGIPILLPGEVIDCSAVEYLTTLVRAGASIVGAEDASLRTIRAVA